ncbi:MAG: hypothetical protein GY733_17240 [bacterium]|nr:hypothetical protein [bacterium]
MVGQLQCRVGSWVACAVVFVCACIVSGPARADEKGGFAIDVIVASLTKDKDGIDQGAKRLHKELQNQFRYQGIRVLETTSVPLEADRVWDMKLPTRRRLRVRPLVVEKDSALISVEISGLVQSDLRIEKGQLIIIGAERFGSGKLVIALEAQD